MWLSAESLQHETSFSCSNRSDENQTGAEREADGQPVSRSRRYTPPLYPTLPPRPLLPTLHYHMRIVQLRSSTPLLCA